METSLFLVIVALGIAVAIIAFLTQFLSQKLTRKSKQIPRCPLSMMETVRMLTSTSGPMMLLEQSLTYGKVFQISFPSLHPFIMCMDSTVTKEILEDPSCDKPDFYNVIEVPRGCPVLISKKTLSTGRDSWTTERKAFAPCFSKNQYDFEKLNEELRKLDLFIAKSGGDLQNAPRVFCQFTLDAFSRTSYGVEMNALGGSDDSLGNEFLVCV